MDKMSEIISQLKKTGIVPVVKIDDEQKGIKVMEALRAGGINCAEITFRTANAASVIKAVSSTFPDAFIGAGTVLNAGHGDSAVEAGAIFIVSPGFNPKTVAYCQSKNIPMLPGCSTASEIEIAIEMGLSQVKFFPAEESGGLKKIKALSGPFPQMEFMPTGGINLSNLAEYLSFSKVIACGGSIMVSSKLIEEENYDEITRISKEAMKIVNAR